MLSFSDATIKGVAIHTVGNKLREEGLELSDNLLAIGADDLVHIMNFFCGPFATLGPVYQLYHPNGIDLNEVDNVSFDCFGGNHTLLESSKFLARHLYDVSMHPNINGGEFYVVRFKNVMFEGEFSDALGLFKSDNKELYAEVRIGGSPVMEFRKAINTHSIDKAALILESNTDEGYTVLIPEVKNNIDRQYWKDDFLQVIARNDSFMQTSNFLKSYKSFVTEKMGESFELDKADQAELLNKGLLYFKDHDTLDYGEFAHEVLVDERAIALFYHHTADVLEDSESYYDESFTISSKAVKKSQSSYKSVLKLDKNFQIYIHGNRDRLSRPVYDPEKGMNYYKVYFENEG